jgi:hypothetical protein
MSPITKNSGTPSVRRVRAFTRATWALNSPVPKGAPTIHRLSKKLIEAVATLSSASPAVPTRRARATGRSANRLSSEASCWGVRGPRDWDTNAPSRGRPRSSEPLKTSATRNGVLEGVECPVHEPEGKHAADYGVEAEEGGDEVETPADKGQVGQHPAHRDEGGEEVGRDGPQRVGEVGEDEDRHDSAQQHVEGEFQRAVDGSQVTHRWRRSASHKGTIFHDLSGELRSIALPRTPVNRMLFYGSW